MAACQDMVGSRRRSPFPGCGGDHRPRAAFFLCPPRARDAKLSPQSAAPNQEGQAIVGNVAAGGEAVHTKCPKNPTRAANWRILGAVVPPMRSERPCQVRRCRTGTTGC